MLGVKGSALDTPALLDADWQPSLTVTLVGFLVLAALFHLATFGRPRRTSARGTIGGQRGASRTGAIERSDRARDDWQDQPAP